ncbi:hypothetical protein RAJCM14343_5253 [Rhodococcus aetherivorans]|uniref:Uncharacterized protein n=1 Tax=Rhodococcus aetherivorans TaxID=191292 RepID=A0ABQ0YTX3_9NOCA|nr:hypothetical protein RAJCM14343_5253 [Rhodococcus aetherivorans]
MSHSVRQLSRTTPSGCDSYLGQRTDNVDKDTDGADTVLATESVLTSGFTGMAA